MYCVSNISSDGAPMIYRVKRRKKSPPPPPPPSGPSKVTKELIEKMSALAKRNGKRYNIGDDRQSGLRTILYPSGEVAFSATYRLEASRPNITVGQYPDTTIEQARHLTRIVQGIADRGYDVREGLHARLSKELERDGLSWHPTSYIDTVVTKLREQGSRFPTR